MKIKKKLQELSLERAQLLDKISEALTEVCPEEAVILASIDIQIMMLQRADLKIQKEKDDA